MAKGKKNLPDLSKTDILKPLDIEAIGSNGDPCFGKEYDLTTKECKRCGDSEICACVFAQHLNVTRAELEKKQHFKDLDTLIDVASVKKYMRGLTRKDKSRKEILESSMKKFEITKSDARQIYKQLKK